MPALRPAHGELVAEIRQRGLALGE